MKYSWKIGLCLVCALMVLAGCGGNEESSADVANSAPAESSALPSETANDTTATPLGAQNDKMFITSVDELDESVELQGLNIKYSNAWSLGEQEDGSLYFYPPADTKILMMMVIVEDNGITNEDDLHTTIFQNAFVSGLEKGEGIKDFKLASCESTALDDKKSLTIAYSANISDIDVNSLNVTFLNNMRMVNVGVFKMEEFTNSDKNAFDMFLNAIEPIEPIEREAVTLGNTFAFDNLEITLDTEISWDKLNNRYSDNYGQDVIIIPVHIKNLSSDTHKLNKSYYRMLNSKGVELGNVGSYFRDDNIDYSPGLIPGTEVDTAFHILCDSEGEYHMEFSNYSEVIEVIIPVAEVPVSPIETSTQESDVTPSPVSEPTVKPTVEPTSPPSTGIYVGSKGSNKYHRPSCRHAKKINAANEIWFDSEAAAKSKGYSACGVCF